VIAHRAVALLEERIQLQFDGVPRQEQPAPRRIVVDFKLIQRQSALR
jgi:DNA-binding LacI/PurR family transcriptional regulator